MYRPHQRVTFGPGGGPLPWAIKWLLITNVGLFVLHHLVGLSGGGARGTFTHLFGLVPPGNPGAHFYPWQPLTYLFLHSDPFHLGINMLMLWMFGTFLERHWGSRLFLRYYFICGLGAALLTCGLALFLAPFQAVTIGASGAILGLMLAFGFSWPERVILIWGILPMKAWTMVLVFGGFEVFSLVFSSGRTNVAYAAHVGGMLAGYIYLKRAWRLGPFLAELRWRLRRRRFRVLDRRDDDFPFH